MAFHSILSDNTETPAPPDYFTDLNLDQIIDAVTAEKEEYDLKPFFYTPLCDIGTILYRHEVMRDLENEPLLGQIKSFAQKMRTMREYLVQAEKLRYQLQQEKWHLDAVAIYCESVIRLERDLASIRFGSRGFQSFFAYLKDYAHSDAFTRLLADTKTVDDALSAIRYCVLIGRPDGVRNHAVCVEVRKYNGEPDYSAEVEKTFEKFKQGAVEDYKARFTSFPDMNHVEERVLDQVSQLYPEIFSRLEDFCVNHSAYLDETINRFDREIQFYIAYLEYTAPYRKAGLPFCYPQVSDASKEVYSYDGFDLALAHKLAAGRTSVVCNDFFMNGRERVIVVSGPNQGGKTTFARMFGQLHYLAGLGLPVPGREARLFIPDRIFTHFEREESIKNLQGKLQDELVRIHDILAQATPDSIVIMNEIFTSTTLDDAVLLSKRVLGKVLELDLLCVCVTFIDELSAMSQKTVSMVSTVVPEDPASRTYKIVRQPADGLAYALSIAEKYRLTYDNLKERIQA